MPTPSRVDETALPDARGVDPACITVGYRSLVSAPGNDSIGCGVALYIHVGAVHGVPVAARRMQRYCTCAVTSFDDIRYRFDHEADETE